MRLNKGTILSSKKHKTISLLFKKSQLTNSYESELSDIECLHQDEREEGVLGEGYTFWHT